MVLNVNVLVLQKRSRRICPLEAQEKARDDPGAGQKHKDLLRVFEERDKGTTRT